MRAAGVVAGWSYIRSLIRTTDTFWACHPALFVGTAFFLGTSIALRFHALSLLDCCLLPCPIILFPPKRLLWALALCGVAAATTCARVLIPSGPLETHGLLTAEVVHRCQAVYHGRTFSRFLLAVHDFHSNQGQTIMKGGAVSLSLPTVWALKGGILYQCQACLTIDELHRMTCKPELYTFSQEEEIAGGSGVDSKPFYDKRIRAVGICLSLVEWRLSCHKALENVFSNLFQSPQIRHFAGGLTFGLYKDPSLQRAMHEAGVEHVLAVSGFHFGIVAALTVFLAQAMTPGLRSLAAMILLSLYLCIVGPLPSVIRAWSSAMVVLLGLFCHRRTSGLNCLGIGLIVSVIYDPASVESLGYQLSFLATAAILFFSGPCRSLLRSYVRQRTRSEIIQLSLTDQALLLVLELFVSPLSLLIPVFVVLCPYQLAFLQDFSSLGLLYNLFLPALLSLAMPAVLLAVVLYPIPILPHVCAFIASLPLKLGLLCVEHIPETTWGIISGGQISHTAGTLLLLGVFLSGIIYLGSRTEEQRELWKACL
jgi:competence protein ComEC